MSLLVPAPKVNNFADDLDFSLKASDEAFWQRIYRKAFPTMLFANAVVPDCKAQRDGVDRIVQLPSGQTLKIDEKKRREEWPDIALEYLGNDKTGAPGWMEKDLLIDYLAYAFMPSKRCFLFDWQTLKRAWQTHGQTWRQEADGLREPPQRLQVPEPRCCRIVAPNKTYNTHSVGVPIRRLVIAVANCQLIQLEDEVPQNENGSKPPEPQRKAEQLKLDGCLSPKLDWAS